MNAGLTTMRGASARDVMRRMRVTELVLRSSVAVATPSQQQLRRSSSSVTAALQARIANKSFFVHPFCRANITEPLVTKIQLYNMSFFWGVDRH